MSDDVPANLRRAKKRTSQLLLSWLKAMGLMSWHIDMIWHYTPIENVSPWASAATFVQWQYTTVVFHFCVPRLLDEEDRLEEIVVHEICHIFTEGVPDGPDGDTARRERATTDLQKAIMWARDAALKGKLNP